MSERADLMEMGEAMLAENSFRGTILEIRNIRKRFGAVQALDGVSFHVSAGEVIALVGDNGAGKSTTIKMIAGVEQPDDGEILFENQSVRLSSPVAAEKLGIQTVYQDLALCDNLDIVANLFLGREIARSIVPGVLKRIDKHEMERRAVPVLRDLGISLPPLSTQVARLSGGQRQAVAVARAVLWGSKLVMFDEPTAALGVAQQKVVLDLIAKLSQSGKAVLIISHNLSDVFKVADRIVVLRLGRTTAAFAGNEVRPEQVIACITGAAEEALTRR